MSAHPDSPVASGIVPSPNHGERRGPPPDMLILHYTGMASAEAALGRLRDPADGSLLDQALVVHMPGPSTFTGEDMAELHLHGGLAVRARQCLLAHDFTSRHTAIASATSPLANPPVLIRYFCMYVVNT